MQLNKSLVEAMPQIAIRKPLVMALFFFTQLLATALLAWHLMAQVSFGYPLGYRLLSLDTHIAEFAAQNRYKQGFEFSTPKDHWRLFSEISTSVQHNGEGLEKIIYSTPNNKAIPLMHQAEVIHLQDVAALIDNFYITGYIAIALLISACYYIKRNNWSYPPRKKIAAGFGASILIAFIALLVLGPVKVFYWFHTKIFPEGHQWFFYYEESLMTTLMKAPDIFAFIGIELLLAWIVIFLLSNLVFAKYVFKKH